MHLTRLDLDTKDYRIRRLLDNEERVHAMLCRGFGSSRAEGKILYRIVDDAARHAIYVYSRDAIDSARLPAGIQVHGERDLTEWLVQLHDGDILRFDLVAVPSKKVAREGMKNSRRVLLRTPEERAAWLQRKAEAGGFELLSFSETEECASFAFQQSHDANSFHMRGIRFSGLLRVVDTARFRNTLADGIGAQRAYGYGMMLLKRP